MSAELLSYVSKIQQNLPQREKDFNRLITRFASPRPFKDIEGMIDKLHDSCFYWQKTGDEDEFDIRESEKFQKILWMCGERPVIFRDIYDMDSEIRVATLAIVYDSEMDLAEESFFDVEA